MNAVTESQSLAEDRGLYDKFVAYRADGSSEPGGKHHGDFLFVMNATADPVARRKVKEYAQEVQATRPKLAADIRAKLRAMLPSPWVTIPEIIVPDHKLADGTLVPGWTEPAFTMSCYLCTVVDGAVQVLPDDVPTVEISYLDTLDVCKASGKKLLAERRAVALAWLLSTVDANWTGGKVGVGNLRQGLHKGSVDGAVSNDYEPQDQEEDRRFYLPNGEVIYDAAGHLFTHIFNDVSGDERGICTGRIAKDSISLAIAPFKSMERGNGWMPAPGTNGSGYALFRGGCWDSRGSAGLFYLNSWAPRFGGDSVGFRCTLD